MMGILIPLPAPGVIKLMVHLTIMEGGGKPQWLVVEIERINETVQAGRVE